MENLKVIKLITGEEILGKIEEADDHVIVTNPIMIALMPGNDGEPKVGFAPWPIHSEPTEKDIPRKVNKNHIVYEYVPAQGYINNYNQIFGAGIVVPPTVRIIKG